MFNEINFQFMKKNYIKPEITVVKLLQMQMLCSSDVTDPDPKYYDEVGSVTQFTRESSFFEN